MFLRFVQMYCLRVKRLKSISSRFISFEPIPDVAQLTVNYGCANDYMCIAYDTNTLSIQFYSAHTIFCSQTVKLVLVYIPFYKIERIERTNESNRPAFESMTFWVNRCTQSLRCANANSISRRRKEKTEN
jgi:hypothetical protein